MFSLFLATIFCALCVSGQLMYGGQPTNPSLLKSAVQTMTMASFDKEAFIARARAEPKHQQGGQLFAQQFDVSISPLQQGNWEILADGTQVWRVEISSPGAASINLWLSDYVLYPGNSLFVYSADRKDVRGQFNEKNNKRNGKMAIAPVKGDHIVVELIVSPGAEMPIFSIGKVNHEVLYGYGDSGSCNINTVCTYTDDFDMRDEVDSVAMILSAAGSRRCTGAMINNQANNSRPLFLTANHCSGGQDTWIFMFNYQSSRCDLATQTDGPTSQTVQGSTTIDNSATSDVLLLELDESPNSYNVYYAGYNANDNPFIPFAIHHPSGDIKKIAWSESQTVSDEWSVGNQDTHWQVVEWDGPGTGPGNQGDRTTTEPGSSGSPLFDLQGRITGQLHGGAATCSYPYDDLYGKLARSWTDRAAIRNALDPLTGGTNRVCSGFRP